GRFRVPKIVLHRSRSLLGVWRAFSRAGPSGSVFTMARAETAELNENPRVFTGWHSSLPGLRPQRGVENHSGGPLGALRLFKGTLLRVAHGCGVGQGQLWNLATSGQKQQRPDQFVPIGALLNVGSPILGGRRYGSGGGTRKSRPYDLKP